MCLYKIPCKLNMREFQMGLETYIILLESCVKFDLWQLLNHLFCRNEWHCYKKNNSSNKNDEIYLFF